MKPIRRIAEEMGLRGAILAVVLGLVAGLALWASGAPEEVGDEAARRLDPPAGISKDLKADLVEDLDAGCYDALGNYLPEGPCGPTANRLRAGPDVGAAANTTYARPLGYLQNRGIKFEWNPTDHWSGRGLQAPRAIVVHVTGGGSCDGIAGWFKNNTVTADKRVSAHFLVCPDKIVQQVEIGDVAWHAGIWGGRYNTANALIQGWRQGGLNPNTVTVGVETLLADGQQLDNFPTMKRNLIELLAFLSDELDIPAERTYIIGHNELDGVNRPIDPVCCMNLDAIVQEVATRRYGVGADGGATSDAGLTRWVGEANPAFFHDLQVNGTQRVYARYDFGLPADTRLIRVEFFLRSGGLTVLDGLAEGTSRACYITAGVGRCDVFMDSGPEGIFTLQGTGQIDKMVITGVLR